MLEREVPLFGLSFFCGGVAAAAERALATHALVFTPNAEILLRARREPAFFAQLERATLLLPDGVSVTLAAAMQGRSLPRAAGVEFGEAIAAYLAAHGGTLFLYGGKEGVAARAAARLRERYPALSVSGTCHGYLDGKERAALLAHLRASPPAVLFVCLGSPRQEAVAAEFKTHLPHTAIAALGGSLDLYAGDVRRAPRPFRVCGCEWLWRVLREPRRIRRVWAIPLFLAFAVRAAAVFWWKVYRTRGKAQGSSVKNHKI